jgi:osmotically-inducible protein OsmY
MLRKVAFVVVGLLMAGTMAFADTGTGRNLQVFKDVSAKIDHYALFSVFDNVEIEAKDGVVTLHGQVTMPYKRDDIARLAAKADGVREVKNEIAVLPASISDDRLRYRIARSIFSNPSLQRYALGPNPSIHIVVDRGHVTLTGVVNSALDQRLAMLAANQFPAFSVTNNLKTEAEVRNSLEHLD